MRYRLGHEMYSSFAILASFHAKQYWFFASLPANFAGTHDLDQVLHLWPELRLRCWVPVRQADGGEQARGECRSNGCAREPGGDGPGSRRGRGGFAEGMRKLVPMGQWLGASAVCGTAARRMHLLPDLLGRSRMHWYGSVVDSMNSS